MYKNILNLSLKDLFFLSLAKLGFKSSAKFLFDEKNNNPTLSIDRMMRYSKIAESRINNFKLNFVNKNVIEIGSGKNYGWAPFAIFHGCNNYTVVEPIADYSFLNENNKENYFYIYFQYLEKMFNKKIKFEDFYEKCLNRIKIESDILNIENKKFDIFLSNSVFEHIINLDNFINNMLNLSNKDSLHFHCVDFGNHKVSNSVFDGIYDINPKIDKKINNINYLRSNDIREIFKKNNIDIEKINLINFKKNNFVFNDYWKKYNEEDLLAGVSLFVNYK